MRLLNRPRSRIGGGRDRHPDHRGPRHPARRASAVRRPVAGPEGRRGRGAGRTQRLWQDQSAAGRGGAGAAGVRDHQLRRDRPARRPRRRRPPARPPGRAEAVAHRRRRARFLDALDGRCVRAPGLRDRAAGPRALAGARGAPPLGRPAPSPGAGQAGRCAPAAVAARRAAQPARHRVARPFRRPDGRAPGRRRPDPGGGARPAARRRPATGDPGVSLSALFRREVSLAWGRGGGPLVAVGFYAGAATLLPLSIGPDPDRLGAVAVGAAWVSLALASLLSLERLFERDYEDGALDLLVLGHPPLELVCAVKCLGQWIAAGVPLALAAPVFSIALGADPRTSGLILACALIGGLAFAFVGGVGAALSLG